MSHKDLTDFVTQSRQYGMTNEQIMQELLGAGWEVRDVADIVLEREEALSGDAIISAHGISKHFKNVKALDNVSLDVKRGQVTALLGPNGAGKTTLVRVLSTLLTPTSGTAEVAGLDVVRDAQALRRIIGLAGQYAAVDEILSGRENLEMVARLYHLTKAESKKRAAELLRQFDLEDAADRQLKTYSGGMRRRLDLAASIVIKPKILFLDEPTTGLDPRSRFTMWNVIRDLVHAGTTVLLTTQYLEEADQLANYVFVIDHGHIIEKGTPDELKNKVGGDIVHLHIAHYADAEAAARIIQPFGEASAISNPDTGIVTMPVSGGAAILVDVVRALDAAGIKISDISLRRPSLDDVFMKLTGHAAE